MLGSGLCKIFNVEQDCVNVAQLSRFPRPSVARATQEPHGSDLTRS